MQSSQQPGDKEDSASQSIVSHPSREMGIIIATWFSSMKTSSACSAHPALFGMRTPSRFLLQNLLYILVSSILFLFLEIGQLSC